MFLALFPLQLAIFPGEEIPLHIFEPRYRQLIGECRDEGTTFGIPPYVDGRYSRYGTEVELARVLRTYDTGEMDIIIRGRRVFRLDELHKDVPDKLYSGGTVTFVENVPHAPAELGEELLEQFRTFLRLSDTKIEPPDLGAEDLSFKIAPHTGLSLAQRIALLRMEKESDRQQELIRHLTGVNKKLMEQRSGPPIQAGGNGHHRPADTRKG